MALQSVTVARLHLREGQHRLDTLLRFLHDEQRVPGVTVLRGIAGFGADGRLRTASLLDLSLDLPLVVEFHDTPERVEAVLAALPAAFRDLHVVSWPASLHVPESPG